MTKLIDIFEAKINGTASPLKESPMQNLVQDFETALNTLVKKGKDFATVNMIWTEMNKLGAKNGELRASEVDSLCKEYLDPVEGKQGYWDVASYGLK